MPSRIFDSPRQAPGEFDHAMIEQRHARFQRHRHAGAVDLGEDVVGQIGDESRNCMRSSRSGKSARSVRPRAASAALGRPASVRPVANVYQAAVERTGALGEHRGELVHLVAELPRPQIRRQQPRSSAVQRSAGTRASAAAARRHCASGKHG